MKKFLHAIRSTAAAMLLLVLPAIAGAQVAAWNPAGQSNWGTSPWAPTTLNTNLTAVGLTRGAGVGTSGTAAGAAWGGNNFAGGATQDITFSLEAKPGFKVSLTTFSLFYRRSSTGPATATLYYAIGSGSYNLIGTLTFSNTTSSGAAITPITLSTINDLQNVANGSAVKFRILPTGGGSSGTWYVYGSGLSIAGTVASAPVASNAFYRSKASGSWKNLSNWEFSTDSASWTAATSLPDTAATRVMILSGDTLSVDTAVMLETLNIYNGGAINIPDVNGKLRITGTFTNDGFFYGGSGTVSFEGTALQRIPAGIYGKLILSNPLHAQLTGNVTVNDTLLLDSGMLMLGNNDLLIGGVISNYNKSHFIVTNGTGGLMLANLGIGGRIGALTFPVGISPTSYTPAMFSNSGLADTFAIRVISGVNSAYTGSTPGGTAITSNVVGRTWLVSESNNGGSVATLTLQWNAADELSGFDRSASYVSHYTTSWNAGSATSATGTDPFTQTMSGITSFSPFAVGSMGALPVKWISFAGTAQAASSMLTWVTASEINNDHFVVMRSLDGKNFTTVGTVKAGGSMGRNEYSFVDAFAASTVYYQLVQVDRDGHTEKSAGIVISRAAAAGSLAVYPNPANNVVSVNVGDDESTASVSVYDTKGMLVKTFGNVKNQERVQLDLAAGVYYMRIICGNSVSNSKLVVE